MVEGEVTERFGIGDDQSAIVVYTEPSTGAQREILRRYGVERPSVSVGDVVEVSVVPGQPDTAEVVRDTRLGGAILIVMGSVFAAAGAMAFVTMFGHRPVPAEARS